MVFMDPEPLAAIGEPSSFNDLAICNCASLLNFRQIGAPLARVHADLTSGVVIHQRDGARVQRSREKE